MRLLKSCERPFNTKDVVKPTRLYTTNRFVDTENDRYMCESGAGSLQSSFIPPSLCL